MIAADIKSKILDIVSDKPGIKGVDLTLDVLQLLLEHENNCDDPKSELAVGLINELVLQGEIVEVEYVLPTMTYRIKSLYFPKGTEVTIPSKKS